MIRHLALFFGIRLLNGIADQFIRADYYYYFWQNCVDTHKVAELYVNVLIFGTVFNTSYAIHVGFSCDQTLETKVDL